MKEVIGRNSLFLLMIGDSFRIYRFDVLSSLNYSVLTHKYPL